MIATMRYLVLAAGCSLLSIKSSAQPSFAAAKTNNGAACKIDFGRSLVEIGRAHV